MNDNERYKASNPGRLFRYSPKYINYEIQKLLSTKIRIIDELVPPANSRS